MKKFLYLRMVAITNCVILALFMVVLLANWREYADGNKLYEFFITGLILTLLALHTGFILFLYYKYYPSSEIPASVTICFRIADTICWICVVLLFLTLIVLLFFDTGNQAYHTRGYYTVLIMSVLLSLLIMVQLTGGHRLLKTIRRNARQQLENSFA
jgi:L-asparagine transporter-like permease